ncbi:programmed cell death protein 2 [Coniella lustricola]|uniref:Programmed cell death protein 2 n=1 Tax=Coniella lustricola TaxID=2025994 RepID=A0A2T3AAH2_9PEZI|nr:programmed cell death protein 2 [Coniella lustricola]
MAPYDSDDSLDDDQNYTETDVLLGYASKQSNGESISRLGGRPQWLASQPPSYALAKCKACSSPLVQLLQLNGELPDRFPGHERRLHVFACRNKACRRKEGSVRVIRATRISTEAANKIKERREQEERDRAERERREAERKEKEKGLGEALFAVPKGGAFGGSGAQVNPFSMAGASTSAVNPFAKPVAASTNPFSVGSAAAPAADEKEKENEDNATQELPRTFAETLSLNNTQAKSASPPSPPEPWPADAELPSPYPVSYLDEAEYETLDPLDAMPAQKISTSSMEFEEEATGSSSGGGKEDKNVFESSIDSTFQKFADRLAQNPDQAIRYEFGGAPLLYSKTDVVGKKLHDVPASGVGKVLPRCGKCGSERVFEVQMTPQAIVELESGDDEVGVLEGMDWGTLIVAVCARDCTPRDATEGESGYVEEWVGVQWEELTAKR